MEAWERQHAAALRFVDADARFEAAFADLGRAAVAVSRSRLAAVMSDAATLCSSATVGGGSRGDGDGSDDGSDDGDGDDRLHPTLLPDLCVGLSWGLDVHFIDTDAMPDVVGSTDGADNGGVSDASSADDGAGDGASVGGAGDAAVAVVDAAAQYRRVLRRSGVTAQVWRRSLGSAVNDTALSSGEPVHSPVAGVSSGSGAATGHVTAFGRRGVGSSGRASVPCSATSVGSDRAGTASSPLAFIAASSTAQWSRRHGTQALLTSNAHAFPPSPTLPLPKTVDARWHTQDVAESDESLGWLYRRYGEHPLLHAIDGDVHTFFVATVAGDVTCDRSIVLHVDVVVTSVSVTTCAEDGDVSLVAVPHPRVGDDDTDDADASSSTAYVRLTSRSAVDSAAASRPRCTPTTVSAPLSSRHGGVLAVHVLLAVPGATARLVSQGLLPSLRIVEVATS